MVTDLLEIIDALQRVIDRADAALVVAAKAGPRVKTLTALPGVGVLTALIILARVGDIERFPSARKLASWAGLTPTVRAPTAPCATDTSPNRVTPGRAGSCARPRRGRSGARPNSIPTPGPQGAARRSPRPPSPANSAPHAYHLLREADVARLPKGAVGVRSQDFFNGLSSGDP